MEVAPVPKGIKRSGVIWWRFIAGILLVLAVLRAEFFPNPNMPQYLKPSDSTQELGEILGFFLFLFLGAWLIYSAYKRGPRKKPE